MIVVLGPDAACNKDRGCPAREVVQAMASHAIESCAKNPEPQSKPCFEYVYARQAGYVPAIDAADHASIYPA